MRIQVAEGLHLNYVEEGKGSTTLLLVGGPGNGAASNENVGRTLKNFSPHFRTVIYDTRGGGESDWSDFYSYKSSADDAAALLRALNIEKAIICGGSNGGILALYFALAYPEMTKALVVHGTSSEVNYAAAKNWRRLAEETLKLGGEAITQMTGEPAFRGNEFKLGQRAGVATRPQKEPDRRARSAQYYGISNLYEDPLTPRLKDIKCPVLILIGEEDKLVGVGGSVRMHRAMPQSVLKIIPKCGHAVLQDAPEVALKEILDLMKSVR